jgi:hypothetical protein
MPIDRVRGPGEAPAPGPQRPTGAQDDGGFSAMLSPRAPAAAASEAGAAPAMSAMALVQAGVDDVFARTAQDRRARRHGRAMLQALGAVQLAMLGGDGQQARGALAKLASTAGDVIPADDPVLRLVLREIEVRAAVELARAESGQDVSSS